MIVDGFNPKKHLCKFGIRLYNSYEIIVDLYQGTILIRFFDSLGNEKDTYGVELHKEEIIKILPLIECDKYEAYNRMIEENFKNNIDVEAENECGYRDGWSYSFWCMSESGHSLIQHELIWYNSDSPYEKIVEWMLSNKRVKKILDDFKQPY